MNNILGATIVGVTLITLHQITMAQSDESDAAMIAYVRCVAVAAQRLDDGISDAQTIAIGADIVCDETKRGSIRSFLLSMDINPDSSVGRDVLERKLRNHSQATSIVLAVRARTASQ